MALSNVNSEGFGKLVYYLHILGLPGVPSTTEIEPSDFSGYDILPHLSLEGIAIEAETDFLRGSLDVPSLRVTLLDIDGAVTSLFSHEAYVGFSCLTESISASDTSFDVDDASIFSLADLIYIEGETMVVSGIAGSTLSVLRGRYGSIAVPHYVRTSLSPPYFPRVALAPVTLAGRRANLYCGEVVNGALTGDLECIFRGYIGHDIEGSQGRFSFALEHISTLLNQDVTSKKLSIPLPRGYYSGGGLPDDHERRFRIRSSEFPAETWKSQPAEGWYSSAIDYAIATLYAYSGTVSRPSGFPLPYALRLNWGGTDRLHLVVRWHSGAPDSTFTIDVAEGSPLWVLGFEPGTYSGSGSASEEVSFRAKDEPRSFFLDLYGIMEATIPVADPSDIVTGYAWIEGEEGPQTVAVTTVNVDSIVISGSSAADHDPILAREYLSVSSKKDPTLHQGIAFHGADVIDVFESILGISSTPSFSLQYGMTGLSPSDFDFTTLEDALIDVDPRARVLSDCLAKAGNVGSYIGDWLGLHCIAPVLLSDGVIGFKAIGGITVLSATGDLDSRVYEMTSASNVVTGVSGMAILSSVTIEAGDEETFPISFDHLSTRIGKTRDVSYSVSGIRIGAPSGFATGSDLLSYYVSRLTSSHFSLFGASNPVIQIPCTWRGKLFNLGDIIRVTHPIVIDTTRGVRGLSSRVAVVVGFVRQFTVQDTDTLSVILPGWLGYPIAPSALATAWNGGTKVLTFGATDLYSIAGETDLSHFEIGDTVAFETFDSATTGGHSEAEIVDIDASTVTLDSDPFFGGSFPTTGAIMRFPDWASSSEDQQAWAYICGADYLLNGVDPGKRWTL